MDSKMEQILELIINLIQGKSRTTKIGDIVWEQRNSHNVKCTNEYNDYTIEQFLIFFKINYLNNLAIIDDETKDSLERLYKIRIALNRKMGELAYKDLYNDVKNNDKAIETLYKDLDKIDSILDKYHLLIRSDDIETMFFTLVENNNYQDLNNREEMKILLKEIKG